MSLIFATQLTAVATTALAGLALLTALFAGIALGKQSKQLKLQGHELADQQKANAKQAVVLSLQTDELRHQADERRRAQANRVFVETQLQLEHRGKITRRVVTPALTLATVVNSSEQPIYDVEIVWNDEPLSIAEMGVWPAAKYVGTILPGRSASETTRGSDTAVGVRFRDAAEIYWVRSNDGRLTASAL